MNLATADTLILYDSDWNLQPNFQAVDRVQQVRVFRLVTKNTIDERIVQCSEIKQHLDHMVIHQGRNVDKNQFQLTKGMKLDMIRFGSEHLLSENAFDVIDIDIDKILEHGELKTAQEKAEYAEMGESELRNLILGITSSVSVYQFEGSPSHILTALNNDCLYETFKRLEYLDLLNVVKVCTRFEIQAKAAFAAKYEKLMLWHPRCDYATMVEIIRVFGSSIRSLTIHSSGEGLQQDANGDFFRAIIENCSEKLRVLKLYHLKIETELPSLRLPFPELEGLELFDCSGNLDLAYFGDNCPKLRHIRLLYCDLQGVNVLIDHKFEELEELRILRHEVGISIDDLEHFTVLNPALIKL